MADLRIPDESKGETVMEILEPLGAGRFLARGKVKLEDGSVEDVVAKVYVPGKMKRRRSSRITPGDYVLVSVRQEKNERRGEILYKYRSNEVKKLREMGYISEEEEGLEF